MEEIIFNIILAVLSTYAVYEYFGIFFELKHYEKKGKIMACLYAIWQMLSLSDLAGFPAWLRLMISIGFVIAVGFCFCGDCFGKFVFAVIYNAVWMLGEVLIGAFFFVLGLSIEKYDIWGSFLSKLLLIVIIKLLRCFFQRASVSTLSWKENALLMVMPVGSMFFTYHLFNLTNKAGTNGDICVSLVVFGAILMMNIVIFVIYIRLSENLQVKHENEIYQLEIDLYNEHTKEKEEAMSEFRKSKHDLKHKLIFLLDLLKEKRYEETEKYIVELIDMKPLEGFMYVHSGNSLVDALVNYKYETAKKHGISFRVKLDIPTCFPLANSDLCIILANALDNAIEANIGVNLSEPYVDLKMKYDSDNLIIIIENSFDGNIKTDGEGHMVTKKQDKENHGIGMASMKKALAKYNGFMNVEVEDKKYRLTCIMYHADDE